MKLITIKELSKLLSVKTSTLYSWVRNGKVPSCKLNGAVRFDPVEIEQWIEASKVTPVNIPMLRVKPLVNQNIDRVINKAIDDVTGNRYTTAKRETSPSQGLRKEV